MEERMDSIIANVNTTDLCEKLKIKTDIGFIATIHALSNIQLLDSKHQDYGPDNISEGGLEGIILRIRDKLNRIQYLTKTDQPPNHESLIDGWRDICNFAIIGELWSNGTWPKSKKS